METKKITFHKYYVTNGETKARVYYSHMFTRTDNRECVTLYEKDYQNNLPKIFKYVENETDAMTDYFEDNKVRIYKDDNPLFIEALKYC